MNSGNNRSSYVTEVPTANIVENRLRKSTVLGFPGKRLGNLLTKKSSGLLTSLTGNAC
jgi:hypothetical protein